MHHCVSLMFACVAVVGRQLVELLKDRHEARDQHKRQSRRAKYQEMVSELCRVAILTELANFPGIIFGMGNVYGLMLCCCGACATAMIHSFDGGVPVHFGKHEKTGVVLLQLYTPAHSSHQCFHGADVPSGLHKHCTCLTPSPPTTTGGRGRDGVR
jgi:hypothetical protein